MQKAFFLKKKTFMSENIHRHDQTKQKRKIVQQTNVEAQVSKIAKIFNTHEKKLLEVHQQLEQHNKEMIMAVYATTEELQKNEIISSRIKMMKSFLDENRGGGRKDKEIDDDIDSLKNGLSELTLSRSLHNDLVSANSMEVRLIYSLIEKNSRSANEIRAASEKTATLVDRLKTLIADKSTLLQSLREDKERLKIETIEVMNSKKTLDSKLQIVLSSRNVLIEQVSSLRATAEQNVKEHDELKEKHRALSDLMAERDDLGAKAAELQESLDKLNDDMKEKQNGQAVDSAAVERVEASVKEKDLADKDASDERSRLSAQQQSVALALKDAKSTVVALQKENIEGHAEYLSQLQAMQATGLAHRQDLDEQTSTLEAFERESERLRESKQAAGDKLALLTATLVRENDMCAALREECEEVEKEVHDAAVVVDAHESTLHAIRTRGKELCTQVAAAKKKSAAALHADMTALVHEKECKHLELEQRLLEVIALADHNSDYLRRLDQARSSSEMNAALSEAAREQCERSVAEHIDTSLQALTQSFEESERAKTAILRDLRSDKKFRQKEERQRDKVLEWKDKLSVLNERIMNLRAGASIHADAAGVAVGKSKSKSKQPGRGNGTLLLARRHSKILTSSTNVARGLALAADRDRESGFASPTAFVQSKRKDGKAKAPGSVAGGGGKVLVTQEGQSLSFAGDWFDDTGRGW